MNLFERPNTSEAILVLDFGSQFTQLIARRVRELGVYCEIVPFDISLPEVKERGARGIILSGGPASVSDPGAPSLPRWVLQAELPVLGICYGMQLLALALGARIRQSTSREYGRQHVRREVAAAGDRILEGLPPEFDVWMSHGDDVDEAPPGIPCTPAPRPARSRRWAAARSLRSSSIPRFATRRMGPEFSRILFARSAAARAQWTTASLINSAVGRSANWPVTAWRCAD